MRTLDKLFSRYGQASGEMNETIHLYFRRADKIDNLETVKYEDKKAQNAIAEFLEYAELLKEYRKSLYERARELYSAGYSMRLQLLRHADCWSNKKSYTVKVLRIPTAPNARPVEVLAESYEGKERHKAIKRFEELKKQYANIETEIDIDKKRWEK